MRGIALVAAAGVTWSLGGTLARFLHVTDPWTIVFWRSLFGAAFLIVFMLVRDGAASSARQFREMGLPGLGVGICFAIASISFVLALGKTTVANILLIQAATPLVAALLGYVWLRELIDRVTWIAIAAVIVGVAIMVSGSFTGSVSPVGDGLAICICVSFAGAIVMTRRWSHIGMVPATALGVFLAGLIALTFADSLVVSTRDLGILFCFGALNIGLGLTFFASGARLVPATLAALISTIETVLGPIWVWLIHNEVPGRATLLGGAIIFGAILAHILFKTRRSAETGARA